MVTVIFDQFSGCISANKDRIKRFVAGIQLFVEYRSLEQRSREVGEDKARIGFAHPKPTAKCRQQSLFTLCRGSSRTRNLLPHQCGGRDVLRL